MALESTDINKEYIGDGSQTRFTIPFAYQDDEQVYVTDTDNSVTPAITSVKVLGIDYTIEAGVVIMDEAPSSGNTLTLYRLTPRTQIYDFQNDTPTLNEDYEAALDRLVMILQEIEGGQSQTTITTSGGLSIGNDQTVTAAGTVTVAASSPRQKKGVRGSTGGSTAGTVAPISPGTTDGQELFLEGLSDSDPLTILNSGNVYLEGDCTLYDGDTLCVYWNSTRNKWVEFARSL